MRYWILQSAVFIVAILFILMPWERGDAVHREQDAIIPSTPVAHFVMGGVVPHHDLALKEIERFWQHLSATTNPNVIVLIGPDHENRNALPIVWSKKSDIFRREHSIALHVPFLDRFFPNARKEYIVIRSDVELPAIENIVQTLRMQLHGDVVIVASVDFSHYLSLPDAEIRDQESLTALHFFDISILRTFDSDHLDSDQSLIAMINLVCPTHNCSWQTFFHGNSAYFSQMSPFNTTSYFSLFLEPSPPTLGLLRSDLKGADVVYGLDGKEKK